MNSSITPSKARTRFFMFCFVGWTAFVCLFGLWSVLLPRLWLTRLILLWSRTLSWMERTILGLDYVVKGLENVPEGACIVAAKHQSIWETCRLFGMLGDPAIVLKAELTRIPVLKWYANASGMIPVDRTGRVKSLARMMEAARKAVSEKRKIAIFPQGTRVAPFDKKPYKSGVAGLYLELGLPIVPLALNSGVFWPRDNALIKPGVITVEFLPPIPAGLSRPEMMERLQTSLDDASDRLARDAETV